MYYQLENFKNLIVKLLEKVPFLEHTVIDTIKILPFLLVAYLIMEYIEHKTTDKTKETIKKSGKFGPLIGSLLGSFPQCGFSVTATNFYAGKVITLRNIICCIFINIG